MVTQAIHEVDRGALLAAFGAVVILLVYFGWQFWGRRRRRRQFSTRTAVDSNQWFERFYPVLASERPVIEEVLHGLALDLGISWTQLRPDDSVDAMLRLPSRYGSLDGEFFSLENTLEECERAGKLKLNAIQPFKGTLREFLDGIRHASIENAETQGK